MTPDSIPQQLQPVTLAPATVHTRSSYSFTTGIICGQVSVFVLLFLVVRYVVFEDGKAGMERRAERARQAKRQRRPSHLARVSSAPPPPITSGQLLSKAGYDISSHPAESMDWLNVLFAQVLSNYRASLLAHKGEDGAREMVEGWLNPAQGVSWLDPIRVTALTLGSSYPLFSNARIRPSDASGRLRAETELEYSDSVTLAIATGLVINFPRPRFAVLPISLGVTLVGLHGTMTVEMHSSPTSSENPTPHQSLRLSLHPDFELDIATTSLLGSRAKLQDLPKIEHLVQSRLRQALVDRVVWPGFWAVGLPALGRGVAKAAVAPTQGADDDQDDWELDEECMANESALASGDEEDEGRDLVNELGEKLLDEVFAAGEEGSAAAATAQRRGTQRRRRRSSGSAVGKSLDMSFTGAFAGKPQLTSAKAAGPAGAAATSRRTGRPREPPRRETGLGGGVRTMPGGSDWGVDGM